MRNGFARRHRTRSGELSDLGLEVKHLEGDMSEDAFCDHIIEEATSEWGGIDLLVNNAFSFLAAGKDGCRTDWRHSFEVGPFTFAKMISACTPSMAARGGGAVVNVSSISGFVGQTGRWTYNAAKGAVNQLTRCAALDLAPYGIRVNSISPGWI